MRPIQAPCCEACRGLGEFLFFLSRGLAPSEFTLRETPPGPRDDFPPRLYVLFSHLLASRREQYEFSERAAATAAATAAELTNWLSNLSLGGFEDSLVNIGVESMGDLR